MPLLTPPSLLEWLANSPEELARYQSGENPFDLVCFNQDSIQHLNSLLDQLANNDEYRRALALHYPDNERRQLALQKMRGLLKDRKYPEVRQFVKDLKADQTLQLVSLYRKSSRRLVSDTWWKLQRQKTPANAEQLTALQQQWQVLIPFTFCTSLDLLDKMPLLKELEAYLWLAKYHFKELSSQLPPEFRENYRQWLTQFAQELNVIKRSIIDVMLGILRVVEITNNFKNDSMINTEVVPLLKQLGILKSTVLPLTLPQSMHASQFANLITSVQKHGTNDQQRALRNLPLFQSRAEDKLPLVSVPASNGHFILIPTHLKRHFIPQTKSLLRWLPHRLLDRRRQEAFFNMETMYHITQFNQHLTLIDQQLISRQEKSVPSLINTLDLFKATEKQLMSELTRASTLRPRGIQALLLGNTCYMLDTWIVNLNQQGIQLLSQKITLAEQLAHAINDALAGTRISLTPDMLKSVDDLFIELPAQLEQLPSIKKAELTARFTQVQTYYQQATQFTLRFLERVQQPHSFLFTNRLMANWTVRQYDRQQVHAWINIYKALVSADEAKAMELVGQIITGENYPSAQLLYETLSPLFQHLADPEKSLQEFIDYLLVYKVLPCVSRVQDPAYQFINSLAPALAKRWGQIQGGSAPQNLRKTSAGVL